MSSGQVVVPTAAGAAAGTSAVGEEARSGLIGCFCRACGAAVAVGGGVQLLLLVFVVSVCPGMHNSFLLFL